MNITSLSTPFNLNQEIIVPDFLVGWRVDAALAHLLPDYSRSRLTSWIKSGEITRNGLPIKAKEKVLLEDKLTICATVAQDSPFIAEKMPLDIIYEDDFCLVLNKSANVVVHPAAGNWTGTLLNGLLYHLPALAQLPRAGLVHRLDKDTTGLMVVAKTLSAHCYLVDQIQQRKIKRSYQAIVNGVMISGGQVNAPIGRHPKHRQKMAVQDQNSKMAITHYRIQDRFDAHTHLAIELETGRTHQIRVHMDHINYPIVGDPLYAGRRRFPKGCSVELREMIEQFGRQALHATSLEFTHPVREERVAFTAPLPADMVALLRLLKHD